MAIISCLPFRVKSKVIELFIVVLKKWSLGNTVEYALNKSKSKVTLHS